MSNNHSAPLILGTIGCALSAIAAPYHAFAEDDNGQSISLPAPDEQQSAQSISAQLDALAAELKAQRAIMERQSQLIAQQQQTINQLMQKQVIGDFDLTQFRGAGASQDAPQALPADQVAQANNDQNSALPTTPVGEAPPPEPKVETKVEAVPEGQGVLTPAGRLVMDPSVEYTSSSTNRLVFRGIELVPGIQIGLIEASDADRSTFVTTMGLRYGVTNRLEVEARVPALYRWDRIEVAQQREQGIVRTIALKEKDLGDVEFAARYQLNRPKGQNPIWVANLRVKSDTGKSPFDVTYDEFGVATGLSTGSGFWAVSPSVNFILPSDPAVIFGSLGYLWHIPRNIDRNIGGAVIGRVDPGDAISGNIGFGFALNPRFSFSLGYRHSHIFPSTTEIGGSVERSNRAQVGSFTFGMSYRLSPRQSVNLSVEMGATADAPDLGLTLRFPISFGIGGRKRR